MTRLRFVLPFSLLAFLACDEVEPAPFEFEFDGGLAVPDGGTNAGGDGSVDPVAAIALPANFPGTVDFGEVECGAPAPEARVFEVTNSGTASLTWQASLSASNAFSLVGDTSGTIAPGAKGGLAIAVAGVAASEAAGTIEQATLTLTTNVLGAETIAVTLKRTSAGGTLEASPLIAFGDVPVTTTSAPSPITIKNTGNRPVSVEIASPSAAAFLLTSPGAAFPVAAGASQPDLGLRFAPTAAATLEGTAALKVTGAVCGASATQLSFSGKGVIGVARTSPGTLAFGKVNCGAKAAAKIATLANDGGAAFTYSASLLEGAASPFTVAPTSGSVAPGGSVTLTITPKAIPPTSSTADNAFGDVLRVTTNALGDQNHDIPLTETAQGAIVAVTPAAIGFGDTPLTTTRTTPLSVTNSGNASITLTPSTTGTGYGLASTSPFALASGATSIVTTRFTPATVGAKAGTAALAVSAGVLCAPLPPAVTLTGNGTNGALGLSTTALAFGNTNCGATASAQTFEVRNTGTGTFGFTISAGKGASTPYTIDPANGSVPAGGKVVVTVTPKPIPSTSATTANLYGDTLTITPTGIVGGAAQTVALQQTARGARLSFTAASVAFNNVVTGTTTSGALGVRNDGNAPVTVTAIDSGTDAASFALTAGPHAIAAGAQAALAPSFSPTRTGAHSASIGIQVGPNESLCAPLPAAVPETGAGIAGALAVSATTVAYPAVACGSAAQTRTVNLSNGGGAALTWNASVAGGGFSISPTTGSLAAGASTSITITSPTFATTRGNVTPTAGTLTITDNVLGSTAKVVSLSATPSGAILTRSVASYAFGSVVTGTTSNASPQPTVSNSGNVNAPLSLTWTTAGRFAAGAGLTANASGSVPVGLSYSPIARGAATNTLNIGVAAGTPLCAALPAGITVSGTGVGGVLEVSDSALDLDAACGGASRSKFALSNRGDAPLTFSGSYPGGTLIPATGTIAPGGSTSVEIVSPTVSQTATPGSTSTSVASFTTNVYGDVARNVTVTTTAVGGNLDFGMISRTGAFTVISAIDFGTVHYCWAQLNRQIRNTGNGGAAYDYPISWRLISGPPATAGYPYRPELVIEQPAPADVVLPNLAALHVYFKGVSDAAPPSASQTECGGRLATWAAPGTYTFEVYLPSSTTPGICHAPKVLQVTATVPYPIQ